MSVLSFPRINFMGYMCWDPATGNNNDYFPTYDDTNASLNWPFLKGQGITQSNFGTTFRTWAINLQTIPPYNSGQPGIPGEWNYFGGNGAYFLQYVDPSMDIDRRTTISGGKLGPGQVVGSDPFFHKTATLLGDPFGNPEPKPPGRLVDVNPASVFSSQIYYQGISFGDASMGIQAKRAYRMQSRFINFGRNYNLPNAGIASVTWQACFPTGSGLTINPGSSSLLLALQGKLNSKAAKGIMVRFNVYLNLYYQNGYFNNVPIQPAELKDLPPLYAAAVQSGNLFPNPCYSRIVGVIGPWYDDELATAPEGRYLAMPSNIVLCNPAAKDPCWQPQAVAQAEAEPALSKAGPRTGSAAVSTGRNPIRVPTRKPNASASLGVALAEVDYQNNILSIDLLNTFPEEDWQGVKANFKTITIGVMNGNTFTPIGTLPYSAYNTAAYELGGGIVDVPFNPNLASAIRDGVLAFQVDQSVWVAEPLNTSPPTYKQVATRTVMIETPLIAQTDQRGVYLNEGEQGEFQVSIKAKGKPAAGAMMRMVKYIPDSVGADASLPPIPTSANQVVNITSGQSAPISVNVGGKAITTMATTVQADANGMVTVKVAAAGSGFPVIVFYPYAAGATPPAPMPAFSEALTSMFTTIRVLPYNDQFVDQFVQLWNSSYDPAKAWDFVYNNILYLYDMIYPVMLKFVPLGDRRRVEAAIDQVLALIAPSYFPESTLAMPITRDLSRGARTVIELWGGLVKKNYPPQPIAKPTIPVA
jgi:hypothetical protein